MKLLQAMQQFDTRLLISIFDRAGTPRIRYCARALSRSAEGYLHLLIPLLLAVLGVSHVTELIALIAASFAIERCTYWVLKNGLKRRRPQDEMPSFNSLIVPGDKFSFPSGHTSSAFLLAAAVTCVYDVYAISLFIWAAGVALSRVLLGVHYPGDTLAGALMGGTVVILTAAAMEI